MRALATLCRLAHTTRGPESPRPKSRHTNSPAPISENWTPHAKKGPSHKTQDPKKQTTPAPPPHPLRLAMASKLSKSLLPARPHFSGQQKKWFTRDPRGAMGQSKDTWEFSVILISKAITTLECSKRVSVHVNDFIHIFTRYTTDNWLVKTRLRPTEDWSINMYYGQDENG